MSSVDDYLALITSFHRGKPKFAATIKALVEPFVDLQIKQGAFPSDYDLDAAIGAQLDAVGEWVGRSRFIPVPIPNAYFSFDIENLGFDLGVWEGPYDSETGITRLDDETYRIFLRAKIAANHWDGTVGKAAEAFNLIFSQSPGSQIFVSDNGDMTMTVGISGVIPSILFIALLDQGYLPLKPEGVRIDYAITSVDGAAVFGFDIDNEFISGFDAGSWAVGPEYFLS